jgi:hypothetical protein
MGGSCLMARSKIFSFTIENRQSKIENQKATAQKPESKPSETRGDRGMVRVYYMELRRIAIAGKLNKS